MTENSLRTAIARAAYEAIDEYHAQPNDDTQKSEHDLVADAVLKALAEPGEDVIERAAEAIDRACFGQELPEAPIDLARAALAALVGGEQDD